MTMKSRPNTLRLLTWLEPEAGIWHPNVAAPFVCPGDLRMGTDLVGILFQLYEIVTYQKFATADCLNFVAAQIRVGPTLAIPHRPQTAAPAGGADPADRGTNAMSQLAVPETFEVASLCAASGWPFTEGEAGCRVKLEVRREAVFHAHVEWAEPPVGSLRGSISPARLRRMWHRLKSVSRQLGNCCASWKNG